MTELNIRQELDGSNDEISSNLMTKKVKNVFKCDICKKVFSRQICLNEHKYIHSNLKPFECLKCGKRFRQSSNFHKHQKLHENETQIISKKIVCKVCGKSFGRQSYLKSHLLSHNNIKTCLCHKCGNTFKYRCDLIRHLKIHENSRQYKCNICFIGFNDSSSLRRHERKVHPSLRQPSVCDNDSSNINNNNDNSIEPINGNGSDINLNRIESDNNNNFNKTNTNTNTNTNQMNGTIDTIVGVNGSDQLCTNLNDANYLNSVIDYINVCRILPQPLPSHIFEKVVDLQKEIALHLGIGKECPTDYYNVLKIGLQDLNAIVLEHLEMKYKIN